MTNLDININSFLHIPAVAFRDPNISYEAAGVFASIILYKTPIINIHYDTIRSRMRGKPSDDEIRLCLTELENEGYLINKIQKIKARNKSRYKLRSVIKVNPDFESTHNHLRPRR